MRDTLEKSFKREYLLKIQILSMQKEMIAVQAEMKKRLNQEDKELKNSLLI